ncbi:putative RecB family exonuclease [Marmoricola sp. OAE513]|uniref:RecB family exonuclease n=1 Tax=Marmoricola sp. OAE513 TaxID=2817894 RepID=UPI001DA1B825
MPESEAENARLGTRVDGVDVLGALSPSRAGDFKSCPLLYRFRTIDRLPEQPSAAAARGTVVHKVLEDLFDVPAPERTPERAVALLPDAWAHVAALEPERSALFATDGSEDERAWLDSCAEALRVYFSLEDPSRLEPAARELYLESLLESKLLLRGYVDRLDVAPDGAIRVVDYKVARAPAEGFEARALFQLKFYALLIWRTRGVIPKMLRLMYLASGEMVSYEPDELDLVATRRQVEAIWDAIQLAQTTGDWQPNKSVACSWCSFKDLCPAWGGTPPPLPEPVPQVVDAEPRKGVDEDPSLLLQDRDVVGHDQDGAARGLG